MNTKKIKQVLSKKTILIAIAALLTVNVWGQTQVGTSPIWYNNGNVGIGTTVPSRELEVTGAGNVYVRVSAPLATDGAGIELSNPNEKWTIFNDDLLSNNLRFSSLSNHVMTLQSGGNVGIGTTSPLTKLQVGQNNSSKTTDELMRLSMDVSETGIKTALHIDANISSSSWDRGIAIELGLKHSTYNEYTSRIVHFGNCGSTRASKLQLQTHSVIDGVWNTGILIDNVGNVGIGTTDPNYGLLHLNSETFGDNILLALSTKDGTYNPRVLFKHNTSATRQYLEFTSTFSTAVGYADFIFSNGNVGIGTNDPAAKLNVASDEEKQLRLSNNGIGSWDMGVTNQDGLGFFDQHKTDPYFFIASDGNVGIGTTAPPYKLSVEGTIGAREVIVTSDAWADFVFEPTYKLMPLKELDTYIQENKHLPEIPTTAEVQENGISVGEMNAKLLQKIEELTLYLIEQEKKSDEQNERISQLENTIKELQNN